MSITGTPIWPDFSTISLRALSSSKTLISANFTLLSLKNSFVRLHQTHVGVVYILTDDIKQIRRRRYIKVPFTHNPYTRPALSDPLCRRSRRCSPRRRSSPPGCCLLCSRLRRTRAQRSCVHHGRCAGTSPRNRCRACSQMQVPKPYRQQRRPRRTLASLLYRAVCNRASLWHSLRTTWG